MKILAAFFAIIILVVAALLGWMYTSRQDVPQGGPTNLDPFISDEWQSASSGVSGVPTRASTTKGATANDSPRIGKLGVQELLDDPDTYPDPYNKGHYYLGYQIPDYNSQATNTPVYVIEFIASGSVFNVSLLQEPIGAARKAAEQYLVNKLGLTPQELCDLNALVTVPVDVNDRYASIDLRFSSCLDTTFLP